MADKLQEIRERRTHNPPLNGLKCFLQDLGNHRKLYVNKVFQQPISFEGKKSEAANISNIQYTNMHILTVAWESGLCK